MVQGRCGVLWRAHVDLPTQACDWLYDVVTAEFFYRGCGTNMRANIMQNSDNKENNCAETFKCNKRMRDKCVRSDVKIFRAHLSDGAGPITFLFFTKSKPDEKQFNNVIIRFG